MTDLDNDFTESQRRELANLRALYESWRSAKLAVMEFDYRLNWEKRGEREYLYRRQGKLGTGTSLGPRNVDTESVHADFQARKQGASDRLARTQAALEERTAIVAALGLAIFPASAAKILRRADLTGMLGTRYLVVGTNAMIAYELLTGHRFAFGLESTEDFDLAFTGGKTSFMIQHAARSQAVQTLFNLLKQIDRSYTKNTERTFQARNSAGYEVELLAAPSVVQDLAQDEILSPIPLPEQECLLWGKPVFQVACASDRTPVPIVAPDPRWMGLHKLFIADKPTRNPLKAPKDRAQGMRLLEAVHRYLPQYPMGEEFEREVPADLQPQWKRWSIHRLRNMPQKYRSPLADE